MVGGAGDAWEEAVRASTTKPEHLCQIENIDGGYRWWCACGVEGTLMLGDGMPLDDFAAWANALMRQHPEPKPPRRDERPRR